MCQFTNLIHWMVLHSPLDIVEQHHHNGVDLFPDNNRQKPFGTGGTSIDYNYRDYQFTNNTANTFQMLVSTTETHLCGELRCLDELDKSYHIDEENHYFTKEQDGYYRSNEIYRRTIDKVTGNVLSKDLIIKNHSKVMYDSKYIPLDKLK